MATEFKIILAADTKKVENGVNRVVDGLVTLRKKVITGKGALEDYNRALNDQLAHNNEMLTPLKALETNYKLVHQELSRMTIAFGENNDIVKELGNAYERAGQQLADYKAKLASNNADASLKDESAKIQAQLEAEQKAIDDSRTYYKALGDSMGYAENEANILNNALKKTISAGGSETAINDAASAYLKQKDAIAEVARQEELYVAQVQNAINQEKAREQAIEDANNASLESWKRYTDFVAQQQAKISGYSLADSSRVSYDTGASVSTTSYSSHDTNLAYYKQIGDNVGYAREEVAMYADELRRLMSLNEQNVQINGENANSEATLADTINTTTEAYKDAQKRLESMNTTTKSHGLKILEITKNILKFQLVLGPIRQALRFVTSTLSESVTVAAEAEQVFNKLATVFDGVESSANSMATSLASSLGVANSTAASALSTVADMLQAQGMGTTESLEKASEWVSQFQDIIAFKDINMDLEEFAQNFMSGATGNLRNFRTFGSIVKESAVNAELAKEGLSDLSEEEENLAKMVTRAELALGQQANAMGATESEWNTTLSVTNRLNEQWKQWKENLGDVINTALTPMKSWLSDILSEANQVTNAMKEIDSGEFTIKYESVASDDAIKKLLTTTVGSRVSGEDSSSSWFWEELRQAIMVSAMAQYGTASQTVSQSKAFNTLYAEDVASISLATGATLDKIKEIVEETGYTLEDNIWERAQEIFDETERQTLHKAEQDKQLAKLQESAIQDYKDSVRAMFGNDDSLASWLSGNSFVDKTSADYLVGGNTGTIGENVDTAISEVSSALSYISTNLPTMQSDLVNLNAQYAQALSDWRSAKANGWSDEEIKAQQELIVAIQKQEAEYEKTISLWTGYQGDLIDVLKDLYTQSAYNTALSTQTGNTADYQKQYDQLRMTDNQKALDDLKRAFAEIDTSLYSDEQIIALNAAYEESRQALVKLQEATDAYNAELEAEAKLKEEQEKRQTTLDDYYEGTADYQKQLRQLRMTDFQKTVDDLVSQLTGDEELDEAIQNQISAYTELYVAQEKYTKELENAEAWKNLGQNALNSLGTVGSAINTLLYGEGDIWTRILSVCLDIFQQSESWTELVEMFDAILEPLMPIVESIVDLLSSMEIAFDIVTFCVKVIASLITSILAGIEMVVDVFEWAWDNVQIAFRNLGTDLYNWTHWGEDKQREEYKDLASYFNETVEKQNDRLDRIWYDMPKESGDLSTLEDLLSRDIINLDQYNAGLRVANKDMVFDPVSPVGYVASSGNSGSTTIKYGDVQVVINGGNTEQIQSTLIQILRKAGYDMPNVPITA